MELQIGVQSLSLKYKNLLIWTSSFEYKDNRICDIVAEAS